MLSSSVKLLTLFPISPRNVGDEFVKVRSLSPSVGGVAFRRDQRLGLELRMLEHKHSEVG